MTFSSTVGIVFKISDMLSTETLVVSLQTKWGYIFSTPTNVARYLTICALHFVGIKSTKHSYTVIVVFFFNLCVIVPLGGDLNTSDCEIFVSFFQQALLHTPEIYFGYYDTEKLVSKSTLNTFILKIFI